MELLLYGDHIEEGEYKVHSTFNNVVNLFYEDNLLSLSTPAVNAGPFNIIFNNLNVNGINRVKISNGKADIDNYYFPFDNIKKWSSAYLFPEINKISLIDRIEIIYNELKRILPDNSLIFADEKKDFSESLEGFEKNLAESMKEGISRLFGENPAEGVKILKGRGKGLTPAGDDFLTGYLYALYSCEKTMNISSEIWRKEVYNISRSSNIISDSQIKAAAHGWFTDNIKSLLDWLFKKNNNELNLTLSPLLSCGATSGADMTAGFILTFKHLIHN